MKPVLLSLSLLFTINCFSQPVTSSYLKGEWQADSSWNETINFLDNHWGLSTYVHKHTTYTEYFTYSIDSINQIHLNGFEYKKGVKWTGTNIRTINLLNGFSDDKKGIVKNVVNIKIINKNTFEWTCKSINKSPVIFARQNFDTIIDKSSGVTYMIDSLKENVIAIGTDNKVLWKTNVMEGIDSEYCNKIYRIKFGFDHLKLTQGVRCFYSRCEGFINIQTGKFECDKSY